MERGAHQNVTTNVEIQARVGGRPGRVSAFDLSVEGCRIWASYGFVALGDPIILIFGEIRIVGRIVSCDGRHAGVEFRNPIHPAVVEHLGFQADRALSTPPALASRGRNPTGGLHSRSRTLTDIQDVVAFFCSPQRKGVIAR